MNRTRDRVIDELLVVRCQEGGRDAFDLLVRRWQRRLWRYARRLTGHDDAAWDVMQEAWLAMLRQIRKLNDPAWFAAWAYRIVRNKCADHVRRAGRRKKLTETLAEQQSPSNERPRDNNGDEVAEALRRLSVDQQELLALKYSAELNVVEIAVVLGVPTGTVKSRLHQAREELRHILEGDQS